jgi:hypothetical protein
MGSSACELGFQAIQTGTTPEAALPIQFDGTFFVPHKFIRKRLAPGILTCRLLLFAHRRGKGNADQYPFWIEKSADGLTPWFFLVLEEHSITL